MAATFKSKSEGDTGGAATTTVTVTMPASIVSGDRLVAVICYDFGFGTITTPGGWALLGVNNNLGRLAMYTRKADGTEAASYNWTTTGATSAVWAVGNWGSLTHVDDGWDSVWSGTDIAHGLSAPGSIISSSVQPKRFIFFAVAAACVSIPSTPDPSSLSLLGTTQRVYRTYIGTSFKMTLFLGDVGESPYYFAPRLRAKWVVASGGATSQALMNRETSTTIVPEPVLIAAARAASPRSFIPKELPYRLHTSWLRGFEVEWEWEARPAFASP